MTQSVTRVQLIVKWISLIEITYIKNDRDRGIRSRAILCNNLDTISSADLAQKLELPSITLKNMFSK